jgi:2-iminobutanoate/2-iminopropanoate deaminase
MTSRTVPDAPRASEAPLISSATRWGDVLFLSGVADVGADLRVRHTDFEGQARAILESIDETLRCTGSDRSQILRVECYLTDASDFEAWNRVWREHFAVPRPARTTVVAGTVVPGIRIELQVTAGVP